MRWLPLAAAVVLVPAFANAQEGEAPPRTDAVDPWVGAPSEAAPVEQRESESVDPWTSDAPRSRTIKRRGRDAGRQAGEVRDRAPQRERGKRFVPPARRKGALPSNDTIASFPGFLRLQNGVSRVWLEVNRRVEITEHKAQGRITFRLKGVNVPTRTNRLPLITGFFATPIERIQLVDSGADADLVIDLSRPSEYTHRVLDTPRGIALQIDFPRAAGELRDRDGEPAVERLPPPRKRQVDTTRIEGESAY
jgi:hypothetical protein